MNAETNISKESFYFIKQHINNRYGLQIVMFFADHPYAQFNELAIIHALNQEGGKVYLQRALSGLVDAGMIQTCVDNNIRIYSLSARMINLVLEIARLDLCHRQLLIKQVCSESVREEDSLSGNPQRAVLSGISNIRLRADKTLLLSSVESVC